MAPRDPDDDEDGDTTPPPVNVALEAWKEATRATRRLRRHAAVDDALHVHLLGLEGQPGGGRIGLLEAGIMRLVEADAASDRRVDKMQNDQNARHEKHERALDRMDRMTWKIVTAAGLGGGVIAGVLELVKFVAAR